MPSWPASRGVPTTTVPNSGPLRVQIKRPIPAGPLTGCKFSLETEKWKLFETSAQRSRLGGVLPDGGPGVWALPRFSAETQSGFTVAKAPPVLPGAINSPSPLHLS